MKTGVFVGLITLDMIYQTPTPLGSNEKRVADAITLAAGGPATNAAVAFQGLGSQAVLVGALGCHPLSGVIRDDLVRRGVQLVDLTPDEPSPPPFSSIIVTGETGDRAVISRNAVGRSQPSSPLPADLLTQASSVLIDGHQMALGAAAAAQARQRDLPVIIDAGSWKPDFETVLSQATTVIAAANFRPPGCEDEAATIAYLRSLGIAHIAITHGANPIQYVSTGQTGTLPVPVVKAVDTLGAGDIFHGAFCHYQHDHDFPGSLERAAQVAAYACQFFGTRAWLAHPRQP